MKPLHLISLAATALGITAASVTIANTPPPQVTDASGHTYTLRAGDPSLAAWRLPDVPHPADNTPSADRVALGHKLFFDPRLSGDGNMSCATCHNPMFGWSDGQPTARGSKSQVLGRATPTVINTAYNSLQMWDGRKKSLEDQAMGPMEANVEMNADMGKLFSFLRGNAGYRELFAKAFPGEAIDASTVSKAIAAFERTIVSREAPFDRWVAGKADAMTPDQVRGFALFVDPQKGNCAACHNGPNFTDNGFHNVGLAAWGQPNPDMGRYAIRPVGATKGAFKTPTVREAVNTAPYFHDGSARTLDEVMEHYRKGGIAREGVSRDIQPLALNPAEVKQIVAFMEALSTPPQPFPNPALPLK